MTVQEIYDQLSKIEDKDIPFIFRDGEGKVHTLDGAYVLLGTHEGNNGYEVMAVLS